jgi:hypothetical protein
MLIARPRTCTRSWMSTPCLTSSIVRRARPDTGEIAPVRTVDLVTAEIRRRRVLGGPINEHERTA